MKMVSVEVPFVPAKLEPILPGGLAVIDGIAESAVWPIFENMAPEEALEIAVSWRGLDVEPGSILSLVHVSRRDVHSIEVGQISICGEGRSRLQCGRIVRDSSYPMVSGRRIEENRDEELDTSEAARPLQTMLVELAQREFQDRPPEAVDAIAHHINAQFAAGGLGRILDLAAQIYGDRGNVGVDFDGA